jgi:hypothetical protein
MGIGRPYQKVRPGDSLAGISSALFSIDATG